jgi:hypothetical protein
MMKAPLSVVKFMTDFRDFLGEQQGLQQDTLVRFVPRFSRALPKLREIERTCQMETAPDFNLFSAMSIERQEELLHTPLLAFLLDPTSAHGQSTLFLRAFLNVCRHNMGFVCPKEPLEKFRWFIRTEVFVGDDSRIDLMVECPQQRFMIVVENKIDSGERHKQLFRYYNWMQSYRGDYKSKQLIFLTPDGRASESADSVPYMRLSYRNDIRDVLTNTLPHVHPRSVRDCLKQYLKVVENLTKGTADDKANRQEHITVSDAEGKPSRRS